MSTFIPAEVSRAMNTLRKSKRPLSLKRLAQKSHVREADASAALRYLGTMGELETDCTIDCGLFNGRNDSGRVDFVYSVKGAE